MRAREGSEDATELRGSTRMELATAMVATGLAYDSRVRAAQAKVLARAIPRVRDIRRFGSAALDLAWTAAGRFDAYFERTVKPWDIAAGALICERAGLSVLDLPEHEDLPYGDPRGAGGDRGAVAGAGWRPGVGERAWCPAWDRGLDGLRCNGLLTYGLRPSVDGHPTRS